MTYIFLLSFPLPRAPMYVRLASYSSLLHVFIFVTVYVMHKCYVTDIRLGLWVADILLCIATAFVLSHSLGGFSCNPVELRFHQVDKSSTRDPVDRKCFNTSSLCAI